ncbi:MAG: hypothetical protein JNG84_15200 [Archangium sp.]|nr:hypothetical protein [Archangium sp.]
MLAALLAFAVAASPPLETHVTSTPRFRIVATEKASGAAEVLAGRIEGLRDQVERAVGRDWPGVTEVRLGMGREEFEALALPGGAPPPWAVALAYPEANVVLVEAHSLIQGDGQTTLRHELVHAALGQLGHGWPRWFQEGVAQALIGERQFTMASYSLLARASLADRLYRFDDLEASFPSRPDDVEIAYAQSAAFVQFLRERHGPRAFSELIDFVGAGDNFHQAFGKAFHAPLSTEAKAFFIDVPHRYPWWALMAAWEPMVWAVLGLLVVAAFVRRRSEIRVLRAEQARVELLEDAASWLVTSVPNAVNDDAGLVVDDETAPWVVHSVRDERS